MEDKESKDMLCDNFGRKIDYLRMSVTDRCNLRCVYCMPGEGIEMLGHGDMLSYEELLRAAKLFAEAGIKKIRLTGGEPLVRKDIITLVEGLKNIRQIEDVSLTTNGLLLRRHLKALSDKGINRLNISIDSMNPQKYAKITRGGNLGTLTDNIISAAGLGFKEIKLNVVITGFLDSSDIRDFINFARDYSLFLRFIEMMDYEPKSSNCATSYNHQGSSTVECCSSYIADSEEKISVQSIIGIINQYGRYERVKERIGFGPSVYYRDKKSKSYIGFIINDSSACSYCNRLRLTSEGRVRLCLFSGIEYDLREKFRNASPDEVIKSELKFFMKNKPQDRRQSCRQNPEKANAVCGELEKSNEDFKKASNLKLKEYMNKIGG